MEVRQETSGDNQEWDWEVLAGDNHNHQRHHKHSNSSLSESDFEPEMEGEGEGDRDGDPSLSAGGVICSDYFSLGFDSREHTHTHIHTHNIGDIIQGEKEKEELEFGSGSWMDPGQAQFPIKSRSDIGSFRNSSDSDSDSPTSAGCCICTSSDVSGSSNLLSILQPHSKFTTTMTAIQSPQLELDFQTHPPVKAELHALDTDNRTDLDASKLSTATAVDVEMESFSHSSSVQFDASPSPFSKPTAVAEKEEHEPQKQQSENENDSKQQEEHLQSSSSHHDNATRRVSWWRVPLEVLKYCVFRVRPIWSLSMAAAALLGFVLLRRAWLSKVKRNAQQGIHLNVTVDDKKVSQFMSRAARLNEAFSVVKRVPIIRPSLPAPGLAPWTVMSMR